MIMMSEKNQRRTLVIILAGICLFCAVCAGSASAQTIEAVIGETIELSGGAWGYNTIYLYMTGPNLNSNGVRLDNPSSAVTTDVPSSFTQAQVSGNHWTYKWDTSRLGGLSPGSYLVFAVGQPLARRDLSRADGDYSTTPVLFGEPGISAGISTSSPGQTGILEISSVPEQATVTVDGKDSGRIPVQVGNLAPGNHEVTLAYPGYQTSTGLAPIYAGMVTEYSKNLELSPTPTSAITPEETEPPAASTPVPTQSPLTLPVLIAGFLGGLGVALIIAKK